MTRIIYCSTRHKPRKRKAPKVRTKKPQPAFVPLKMQEECSRMVEFREMKQRYRSKGGIDNATVKRNETYDDPLLQDRDEAARAVKHTVAPICNKGAYQLITGGDIKTAGRKV